MKFELTKGKYVLVTYPYFSKLFEIVAQSVSNVQFYRFDETGVPGTGIGCVSISNLRNEIDVVKYVKKRLSKPTTPKIKYFLEFFLREFPTFHSRFGGHLLK